MQMYVHMYAVTNMYVVIVIYMYISMRASIISSMDPRMHYLCLLKVIFRINAIEYDFP